ncbi:hypothetical protein X760_13610 [Mesorhizobium sp. LSHC422A00]|nr:hypothetical protein X760_13610 [Mesorhizobium sp. LSHC422A00]ESZ39612.1 hypothetical protein X732_14250 [Mesorhizobium sp. L2C066B000]
MLPGKGIDQCPGRTSTNLRGLSRNKASTIRFGREAAEIDAFGDAETDDR